MLEQTYWACADLIALSSQLSTAPKLPEAELLQRRITAMFDEMVQKARAARIPEEDINDIRYALAAFIDEQVLRSPWPGRQQWLGQPLQFVYFRENTAGEGFFTKLSALESQPHRSHVLQIYYLCLALGFQGRYAVQGQGQLELVLEQTKARLARQLQPAEPISPHGILADDAPVGARRRTSLIAIGLGLVALSILVFIGLRIGIGMSAGNAAEDIQKLQKANSAPGSGV